MVTRDEATEAQVQASHPDRSTWLSANAGSGKTRVLIDRAARLLLSGVPPERILCLTYTKAAAAEMQNRLFARLSGWVMLDDDDLRRDLEELGVEAEDNSPERRADARTLFAKAIETPGGLKVQTIHSFCASLLRRFPVEAGVSPSFSEADERSAAVLQSEILEEIADGPDGHFVTGLARLVPETELSGFLSDVVKFKAAFLDGNSRGNISAALGVSPGETESDAVATAFGTNWPPILEKALERLRAVERVTGFGKGDARLRDALAMSLERGPGDVEAFDALCDAYLTMKGEPRKSILSLTAKDSFGDELSEDMLSFLDPLLAARDRRFSVRCAADSERIFDFAHAFVTAFEERKSQRGLVDFDDLIFKSRRLLSDTGVAAWVLYRLDGGLDHLLVDEAQDTSPEQWELIRLLTAEFTVGEGARDIVRTVFAVGDPKQSIYSFQGAAPQEFANMRDHFGEAYRKIGHSLQDRSLLYSFRSAPPILTLVDDIFANQHGPVIGVAADRGADPHKAFKTELPGRVDLWPPFPPPEKREDGDWFDPLDRPNPGDPTVMLARNVARQIRNMIGSPLPDGKGGARPITAGDIMVLVQRRTGGVFREIISACKEMNLPIAGADRLKVGAELAVKDLTAVLSVISTPSDDLSLAAALKSPLFGWTERMLHDLAASREGGLLHALFSGTEEHHRKSAAVFEDLRAQVDYLRPHELIERLLTRHCGRLRLLSRLGAEARDGIEALIELALKFESVDAPSLDGFLTWLSSDDVEVKRSLSSSGGLIRVMTVHGAKGLESPIVILPDTAKRRIQFRDRVILADGAPLLKPPAAAAPDLVKNSLELEMTKINEESNRLLYVAMTRAEQWLIIAAAGETGEDHESWHSIMAKAVIGTPEKSPVTVEEVEGALRIESGDWTAAPTDGPSDSPPKEDLPDWLTEPAPPPEKAPPVRSPSDLGGAKALPGAANLPENIATLRGSAVHELLEILPGLPEPRWEEILDKLRRRPDMEPLAEHFDGAAGEALAVLRAPGCAEVFAPGTLAEVPFAATVGGSRYEGIIDRLILDEGRAVVVDHKTNAVVPGTPAEVPEGILRQMAVYRAASVLILPGRRIEVRVLWTANATQMTLPDPLLDECLSRIPALDPDGAEN